MSRGLNIREREAETYLITVAASNIPELGRGEANV
jgi:hypothetical protein